MLNVKLFTCVYPGDVQKLEIPILGKVIREHKEFYGWGITTTWGAVLKCYRIRQDENHWRLAYSLISLLRLLHLRWLTLCQVDLKSASTPTIYKMCLLEGCRDVGKTTCCLKLRTWVWIPGTHVKVSMITCACNPVLRADSGGSQDLPG